MGVAMEGEIAESDIDRLPSPPPSNTGAMLTLGAGLILIALNMRGLATSVSAVLPEIVKSTGLSPSGASWLTTMPSLCFGLFGPLAPSLAQ